MSVVISVENVSKQYRLGEVGTGTLSHDLNRWWHKVRGKEDPYLKIGEVNDRTKKAESGKLKAKMESESADGKDSQLSAFNSQLSDASASYAWALRDINFEVKQGEVLGIIGRNGAGKSTLLKILSRVTTPTTGQIKVKGRIASLLEVGTGFHPELTGRENIFLNGAILGMRKAEIAAKFDEIVDFSGCERYIDTPVKRYSSGMYVRLAFAVAAHLEPEVLIIDEVLAVGDAEFQKKCLGKMKDVAGQGRTVLFVSHNMPSISKLTDRCLVFSEGALIFNGSTRHAINFYLQVENNHKPLFYQLSDAPRSPGCNSAVTLVSAEFNRPKACFEVCEDLEFTVCLRANLNVSELRFSMTVSSEEGNPIGSTCSKNSIRILAGQQRILQIRLPQPRIAPGHYHCALALGSGTYTSNRVDFDVVSETLHFEVTYDTSEGGMVGYWNDNWGKIVLPDIQMDEVGLTP